jgi:ribosomal protein S15P/S13E
VGSRRKLLKYLREKNVDRYKKVIERLGLRK